MNSLGDSGELNQLGGVVVGTRHRSAGRTLTRGECALLCDLTWTIGRLHTDREFAAKSHFKDIILPGAVLVAVATGLINTSDFYRDLSRNSNIQVLAALGVRANYRKAFYSDDTVVVETTVEHIRPSSTRAGEYILSFSDEVLNQRDEVLVEMCRSWRVSLSG